MAKIIRPPTQEEMRDLTSLLSSGEPYEILGCDPDSTQKEITKRYRDLARKYHPDKQQHNGNNKNDGGDMMTKINNAYKLLSNERFKEVYDVYLLQEMMMDGDVGGGGGVDFDTERIYREAKFKNILITSLGLVFNAFSIPFRTIAVVIQSNPTIIKPMTVVKSMVKGHGFFKGLFRGTTFLLSSSVLELIREKSIETSFKYIDNLIIPSSNDNSSNNNNSNTKLQILKSFINISTKAILNFPIRMVGNILILSPPGYGAFRVIKDVILRYDQATTGNIIMSVSNGRAPSIQWKNLFYSLGYSLAIVYSKKLIIKGLKVIDNHIYEGSVKDPNNKFYRYSNYLLSKTLFRVALQTILVNPFDVLHSQYPRILLDSWLNGSIPVPAAQNPISLAIDIYRSNNNSITKFFNGLIPLFFCKIFEDFCEQCDLEDFDNYEDDDIYA
ncbi:hypothetical protein ACTFIZ_006799 [Dictyostelium cf. discoideum]